MKTKSVLTPSRISGRVRAYHVRPDGRELATRRRWESNSILSSWCGLVIPLFNGDDPMKYRVAGMYIEFENNGGIAVTPPTFDRLDDAAAYYESLALSSTRDYLRVPIIARATAKSSEDYAFDNQLTVTARTSGVVGQNGKDFTAAAQSRVYGGAVIAMPDESDETQDRILARFYWDDTSRQLVKLVGAEIGYDWEITVI